jgi:hypothetical protein
MRQNEHKNNDILRNISKLAVRNALRSLVRDSPDEKIPRTPCTLLPGPSAPVVTLLLTVSIHSFIASVSFPAAVDYKTPAINAINLAVTAATAKVNAGQATALATIKTCSASVTSVVKTDATTAIKTITDTAKAAIAVITNLAATASGPISAQQHTTTAALDSTAVTAAAAMNLAASKVKCSGWTKDRTEKWQIDRTEFNIS